MRIKIDNGKARLICAFEFRSTISHSMGHFFGPILDKYWLSEEVTLQSFKVYSNHSVI